VSEQLAGKHGPDTFSGAHPEIQERFEAELLQYCGVSPLPAALTGDQVGGQAGFQADGNQGGHRRSQTVQDDGFPALRRTEDHAGHNYYFGAAQRGDRLQRTAPSPEPPEGHVHDAALPVKGAHVTSGPQAHRLFCLEAEQASGEGGGDGGIANADFAQRDQLPWDIRAELPPVPEEACDVAGLQRVSAGQVAPPSAGAQVERPWHWAAVHPGIDGHDVSACGPRCGRSQVTLVA
jgi:hypothetical protein